jgi:predicted ribosomally synthesized peptide with nif11-like leader
MSYFMNAAKAFIQHLENNPVLANQLETNGWQPQEIARTAHKMGYNFSMSELKTALRDYGITPVTSQLGWRLYADPKQIVNPQKFTMPRPHIVVVPFNSGSIA